MIDIKYGYYSNLIILSSSMNNAFHYSTLSESIPEAIKYKGFLDAAIDKSITEFESSDVTLVGKWIFSYCNALTKITIPNATLIDDRAFYRCDNLEYADIGTCGYIGDYAFLQNVSNYGLSALIIRNPTSVCTLYSSNALNNTLIATGSGFIYVPDSLVESYKSANNWSVYSSQIKGLSELEEAAL